ncbi:hypothetical protein OGH69_05330 [Flavobacterium sp. MFBS3-15]|uniref:hypothetical protein n=1 Tax=Flavobacterium sp. MFBS3-15 TaxID=2989816 RepID=UPI002236BD14|nr:hypothetical protein [Flavobacterium sp. MFBS3-15]MCW4468377.1 hypothetical protein [Flavobacterium sp. MFBS3-15]
MKYFGLLLLGIVLVSCKKETPQDIATETSTQATDTTVVEKVFADKGKTSKLEGLVADFSRLKENTMARLSSLKPEEANKLYDEYEKQNNEIIGRMNVAEGKLLEDFHNHFYDNNGDPIKLQDSIQHKKDLLEKAGLEFWHIGEGMGEIRAKHDYYLKMFNDYVTPDYKRFLALQSFDDSDLWSADAGLAITWEELSQRVINWEDFLLKYPGSKLYARASANYRMYRLSYLFGQDNTPTHEHEGNTLYPEIVEEYNRFIKKHPDSPTAKIARQMLRNSGNIGFEGIHEQETTEFQKAYNGYYDEE